MGIVIARGMTGYIGALLGEVFGIAQKADEISTNPALMTFAVVLGVITSVVAAFIPARNAARVDPVQALQKGKYQQLSAGENRMRRIAALIVALLAWRALLLGRYPHFVLRRRCTGGAGGFAAYADAGAVGGARASSALEMAAAGGRNARGRQLAASAAPNFRRGRGVDAVARAGGRAGWSDARQLRFDFQMAHRGAESRSVCFADRESHRSRVFVFPELDGRPVARHPRNR